jgi:hypothetical protein
MYCEPGDLCRQFIFTYLADTLYPWKALSGNAWIRWRAYYNDNFKNSREDKMFEEVRKCLFFIAMPS